MTYANMSLIPGIPPCWHTDAVMVILRACLCSAYNPPLAGFSLGLWCLCAPFRWGWASRRPRSCCAPRKTRKHKDDNGKNKRPRNKKKWGARRTGHWTYVPAKSPPKSYASPFLVGPTACWTGTSETARQAPLLLSAREGHGVLKPEWHHGAVLSSWFR